MAKPSKKGGTPSKGKGKGKQGKKGHFKGGAGTPGSEKETPSAFEMVSHRRKFDVLGRKCVDVCTSCSLLFYY